MWTVRLLVCSLHCVFATGVNISTGTKDLYITENENAWWDARRNCQTEHERDLYTADREPLPSALDGFLNNDTFYWVGAMRYSTWIWTADESPLYSYVGYSQPGSGAKVPGHNSVYTCHLACKNKDRTFGLSGNKCYCLDEKYEATNTSAGEMQCPGNLDEKCGNSTGMSVYTLGAGYFEFTPTQHGACGYAVVSGSISVHLNHYRHCLTQKRRSACYQNAVCHPPQFGPCQSIQDFPCVCVVASQETNYNEAVCVSSKKNRQSWIQAYHNCRLVKLDNSTIQYVKETPPGTNIWIGLAFKVSRKWINGNNAYGYEDYYPFLNSPIQMCLALKTRRPRKFYWLPCSLHLASICEGISTTESQVSNNDDGVYETDTQTGLYVGLGAGIGVLLLIVIAVVFFVRRQRTIRLEREDTNQQMNFNMPTDNATYVPRDNGEYSVINPIAGQSSTPRATVNPSSHAKKAYKNYSVADVEKDHNSAKVKGDAGLYDHMGGSEGHYDTAQTGGGASRLDESYSHIGAIKMGFEEGDYDVANARMVVTNVDDTYNHTYETDDQTTDSCNTEYIARE